MDGEYAILDQLQKTADISQRQLASKTDLSLASVNFLLKKMIKKGLVKIERVNARSLRYIITPNGMREKAALAHKYMKNSYLQIVRIKQALQQIMEEDAARYGTEKQPELIFYGPPDEMQEILKLVAADLHLRYQIVDETMKREDLPVTGALEGNDGGSERRRLLITWTSHKEDKTRSEKQGIDILDII